MIRPLIILGTAVLAGCAGAPTARVTPTPIEFSRVGDDGVTLRISDAVLNALLSSGDFVLKSAQLEQAGIRVAVIGHAAWRRVGERIDATVGLDFYRADGLAAATTVRCYQDEAQVCGYAALEFARRFAGSK